MNGARQAAALPAVKSLTLLARNPTISKAYFHHHFQHVHGLLGLELVQIRRYIQFHANLESLHPFTRSIYDGHAECWFDSVTEHAELASLPDRRAAWLDGLNMSDKTPGRHPSMLLGEQNEYGRDLSPLVRGSAKGVLLIRKLHTASGLDFRRWWIETLADQLLTTVRGLARVATSLPREDVFRRRNPAYDGIVELWWDAPDALENGADLAEFAAMLGDSPVSIDDTESNVGVEVIMRWPGHIEDPRSPERDRLTAVGIPIHQWIVDRYGEGVSGPGL